MTERRNFSGQVPPSVIDTEYRNCNFSQPQPVDSGGGVLVGVELFPGDNTPRTFIDCNLTNAEPPTGSTVTGGNTAVIQMGLNSVFETVTVANETVTIQHHVNRVQGRWTSAGYEYKATPEDIEVD